MSWTIATDYPAPPALRVLRTPTFTSACDMSSSFARLRRSSQPQLKGRFKVWRTGAVSAKAEPKLVSPTGKDLPLNVRP